MRKKNGLPGRPFGSKTKKPHAYEGRTQRVKAKYGRDFYKRTGKMGGNPVLVALGKKNRAKGNSLVHEIKEFFNPSKPESA